MAPTEITIPGGTVGGGFGVIIRSTDAGAGREANRLETVQECGVAIRRVLDVLRHRVVAGASGRRSAGSGPLLHRRFEGARWRGFPSPTRRCLQAQPMPPPRPGAARGWSSGGCSGTGRASTQVEAGRRLQTSAAAGAGARPLARAGCAARSRPGIPDQPPASATVSSRSPRLSSRVGNVEISAFGVRRRGLEFAGDCAARADLTRHAVGEAIHRFETGLGAEGTCLSEYHAWCGRPPA